MWLKINDMCKNIISPRNYNNNKIYIVSSVLEEQLLDYIFLGVIKYICCCKYTNQTNIYQQ